MTIYVPPPVPLLAPAPAPLQPRQFFTPGLALGIPKPKQPEWAQRAAYQRDRAETAHLIQRTLPRITAAQLLAAPIAYAWAQGAAYRRDRIELAPLIRPVPLATAAQPLGAPLPYLWAQQAAYERDRIELAPLIRPVPLATAALPLAAPIAYVWAQGAAYQQPRLHDRSMLIEIGETVIDFTAGFALGAPPPPSFDQFAALRRDGQAPLQRQAQFVPPPAPIAVPYVWAQTAAYQRDRVALEFKLQPLPTLTAAAAAPYRAPPLLQLPARMRGDDPAILRLALQSFATSGPAILTVTRLEFAIAGEAMRFSLELERRMFSLPQDGLGH